MKITFLGTAAAEGFPAMFCNCETCKRARAKGGKNLRTRSQILIGDDLLIDFPPDGYMHSLRGGLNFSAVKYVLFTHAHADHCCPIEFIYHGAAFAHDMISEKLGIFGNETVIDFAKETMKGDLLEPVAKSLDLTAIKPYQTFALGKYEITTLPAEHTPGEDCLLYLISSGGKTCFIFNDSGVLSDSVYDFMQERNIKIDLVSFDCTYGYRRNELGRHMGLPNNVDEMQRMKKRGLLSPSVKLVATHFSHNCDDIYDEFTEKAAAHGFITACDGLTIEI